MSYPFITTHNQLSKTHPICVPSSWTKTLHLPKPTPAKTIIPAKNIHPQQKHHHLCASFLNSHPPPLFPKISQSLLLKHRNILLHSFSLSNLNLSNNATTTTNSKPFITKNKLIKLSIILCLMVIGKCLIMTPPLATACAQSMPQSNSNIFQMCISLIQNLDKHLNAIIDTYGSQSYIFLFLIVFLETGLVLTPFLPGDSLLFAAGALSGLKKLRLDILFSVFISSAILGDAMNYAIGSWLGAKLIKSKLISKNAIKKTEAFYGKHGGKTIILARFVPIVRTFAPFVAGVSKMNYRNFATYNVVGAIIWTLCFCGLGFFFGNLPFVEKHFSTVVFSVVGLSMIPIIFEYLMAKRKERKDHSTTSIA